MTLVAMTTQHVSFWTNQVANLSGIIPSAPLTELKCNEPAGLGIHPFFGLWNQTTARTFKRLSENAGTPKVDVML